MFFLRPPGGRRSDDDAAGKAGLLAELADDAAQPGALVARFDFPGDADMVHRGHENEEAARHGGVRGEARPLRPERLLRHLDDDFLPFFEKLFDLGVGAAVAPRPGAGRSRARAPPTLLAPRFGTTLARGIALAGATAAGGGIQRPGSPGLGRGQRHAVAVGRFLVVRFEAIELLEGGDDV